ncbi:MAG: GFA family protein [Gammaproteobacteria bacterium]|nr:GFA family protein [Gammaproteobacteria bacterium]
MSIEAGGCFCAAVRYRVDGAPTASAICHCRSCRQASGAAAVAWLTVPLANFHWTHGTPRTHRSSPGVERTFCERCGTPLTYARDTLPGTIDVTTASLDDPARFPPTREVWVAEKLPWQRLDPSLAHRTAEGD